MIRRVAFAVGWLAAVLAIALGAAGLVAAIGAPPGAERPELTSAGDEAMAPGLQAAEADVRALRDLVRSLGQDARTAVAALVATDRDLLTSSVEAGTARLAGITDLSGAIQRELRTLPGVVAGFPDAFPPSAQLRLGPATRARWQLLDDAASTTARLPAAWARFTAGSLAAERLTTLLIDHDAATAAAAREGGSGRYVEALGRLDESDRITVEARTLRDRLAASADVTTLDAWIDRNAAYDAALRALYETLRASGGRVTDEVRAAFAAEQAARAALPADTRALVVILSDIARGSLNEIAVGIERAQAQIDEALAALEAAASPSPTPGP